MDAPAAEPTYVEDVLIDLLGRYPWLAAAELVALAGDSRDQVRRALDDLMTDSLVVRRLVQVAPWPRAFLYALARPDGQLPAPQRLVRLEHTRLLHTLLIQLTPLGDPPTLRTALSGEVGGPPVTATGPLLTRLADAWLCTEASRPAGWSGMLVRWDTGERTERAERRWLDQLAELESSAPVVAVVCVAPEVLEAWWPRPGRLRSRWASSRGGGGQLRGDDYGSATAWRSGRSRPDAAD